jgi:16S rRNA (cytidine1402-2'-O)-methyltransferase
MASGMNGQHFRFWDICPSNPCAADHRERSRSAKTNCTQIFIETPYRNNQLFEILLKTCKPNTRLCVAVNITGIEETIRTKTIVQWKSAIPELHKRPAIFLIQAG